ncbi:hypothetical protein AZF37_03000 [endosymbiont 'TC1' of Trimyema compressum]|nr:hypothetical protein AZF37_03000 [endosymbiont 'TC1' of Trimyema compressum]
MKQFKKILGNVNTLTLIISLVFALIAFIFANPLLEMMGGSGEALSMGVSYFRVTLFGSIFVIYGLGSNMIIRGEGKMKLAAVIMGVGLLFNIVSNYILIALLGFGVEGAAWGTNIGMLVYAILGFVYFAKGKVSFKSNPFAFNFDRDILKTIIRYSTIPFNYFLRNDVLPSY